MLMRSAWWGGGRGGGRGVEGDGGVKGGEQLHGAHALSLRGGRTGQADEHGAESDGDDGELSCPMGCM